MSLCRLKKWRHTRLLLAGDADIAVLKQRLMRNRRWVKVGCGRPVIVEVTIIILSPDQHGRVQIMFCLPDMRCQILHIQPNPPFITLVCH